ncbi:hypothetical protein [Agrobacterium tumefaciens]|uniref:hypothetical protein n=1 Tax=Agrobacterium tumefaciens TaxID=358 RepID=UPI001295B4E8|nr:hypothetical protein [Agrobacterium tumefaciens]
MSIYEPCYRAIKLPFLDVLEGLTSNAGQDAPTKVSRARNRYVTSRQSAQLAIKEVSPAALGIRGVAGAAVQKPSANGDRSPPSQRSRIEVGVLILPVLTVLYWGARFDVRSRFLIAKRPIDADSSQNFFFAEIAKTPSKSKG